MPRLRKRHLPHRVAIELLAGEGAESTQYSEPETDVPAYCEDVTSLVVDRRTTSPTFGQEVTSTAMVVLLPGRHLPPGSFVTLWAGTERERRAQVIVTKVRDYNAHTPNHIELRTE
jgi:hypothetical protein